MVKSGVNFLFIFLGLGLLLSKRFFLIWLTVLLFGCEGVLILSMLFRVGLVFYSYYYH